MALFLVTAPQTEPVSVDDAKKQLRVFHNDEDALITSLIVAAREYVETYTHRALITQTWQLKLDDFPCDSDSAIWLPKPPISAVSSITYVNTAGNSTTWSSTLYVTDLPTGPYAAKARIVPAYGETYPSARDQINAVTVEFVAGYGAAAAVPHSIRAAIKHLVATWYGPARSAVNVGNLVSSVPMAIDALLWPFKAF